MQDIVRNVLVSMQNAGGVRVSNVQLVVGASGHFTADAAYQHFEALTRDTPAENASLTIEWLPATYRCFSCQHQFESCEPSDQVTCPRCDDLAVELAHQDVCYASAIDIIYDEGRERVDELVLLNCAA